MNHKVSIVVITKNRPEYLELCLESITLQTYSNLEYIIVDADSNQETLQLIDRYMGKIPLRLINTGDCTIGYARQIGFKKSTGDIIAYIDSDVELPHENWIQHMLVPFKQAYISGVQTLAKNKTTDHPALKKIHSSFEYKNRLIDIHNYEPIGTSHILIRKTCIADAGGFKDTNFKEDTDLTRRIMEQRGIFRYLPDEKCYHYHVDSYKSYAKKKIRNITGGKLWIK